MLENLESHIRSDVMRRGIGRYCEGSLHICSTTATQYSVRYQIRTVSCNVRYIWSDYDRNDVVNKGQ